MTVVVYKFGIHYKWTKAIPAAAMDQLRLAHRFREGLVEIYHAHEKVKKAIWATVPAIKKLQDQIDAHETDQLAAINAIAQERVAQRTRNPQGPAVDQASADRLTAQAATKALRAQLKAMKSDLFKNDPVIADAMRDAAQDRFTQEKTLKQGLVQGEGLYHGTAYLVENQHKTAVKNLTEKRKQGQFVQLRHHRFEGTGNLSVSLKGRGGINTRTPDEISDPDGPHRNVFSMWLPTEEDWAGTTAAQRRHQGRVIARFRIAAGKADTTNVIELPVQIHRALPANAVIKTAQLNVSKVGTRQVASLLLLVTVDDPLPQPDDSTLFCHFGWRSEASANDGSKVVRSMTWRADAPLTEWPAIKADPRYAELVACMDVAPDLMSGTVAIPASWSEKIALSDEIKSQRDLAMNDARERLVAWLAKQPGPVDHPTRVDPATGLPEQLVAANVAKWRNPMRLVRLALDWRDAPSTLPGGQELAHDLESWRAADKRMHDTMVGTTTKAYRRRDDVYAQIANLLASGYATVIVDDADHAALATKPKKDVSIPNKVSKVLGRQRAFVAAATLREKICSVAAREGATVTKVSSAYVSTVHATCATLNVRKRGQMKVMCRTCKSKYDVDNNALDVLQLRG